MKKFITVLLSISMLLSITGCDKNNKDTETSEAVQTVEVINAIPFPDIRLDIPKTYEVTSSEYIDEFYKHGNASVIVTSKSIAPSTDMDTIVYDALSQYQQIADTLTELSSEDLEINGCKSRIAEITYSIVGEENTLNMYCCFGFIIKEDSLYMITCSVPTEEYKNYVDEFKNIIKSAKPLNK